MIPEAYDDFAVQATLFAQLEDVPIAFPGVAFQAPSNGLWLVADWVPNKPLTYGISNNAPSLERGLAMITVNGDPGAGLLPVLRLAEKVRQAFEKGARFGKVKVYSKPALNVLPQEPHRQSVVVTLQWHGSDR